MISPAASSVLTTWQFAPFAAVPATVLAVCYLAAAVTFSVQPRRAHPWPAAWTASFLGGLAVVAVATQSWAAVHDGASLAAHMIADLLLIMVAPPLLIAGRPVTLLLYVTGDPWHSRVKRLVSSRAATALTCPAAGLALYAGVVAGTHLTGLIAVRGTGLIPVHGTGLIPAQCTVHLLYLAAGYLFFLPVIGTEPVRWRPSALGRYQLLLAAMVPDIITGTVLMLHGPLGRYPAADVHAAGVIMLAGSQLLMTALAIWLAVGVAAEHGTAFEPG